MKTKLIVTTSIFAVLITATALWLLQSYTSRRSDIPVATAPAQPQMDTNQRTSEGATSAPIIEPEGPITATAQITRGDKSVIEAKSLDGEFGRIHVQPKEVLKIHLRLEDFDPSREVRIDVDNGGNLDGRTGSLSLRPSPREGAVEFQYTLGPDRGKYTVFVTQGRRQEQFDFWVGPELPSAKPVPWRDFTPEDS